MTPVALIEFAGFLCTGTSLALTAYYGMERLDREVRLLLLIVLALLTYSHFAAVLEWLGAGSDRWGNALNNLVPVFWALTGYSWVQMGDSRELKLHRRREKDPQSAMSESQRQLRTLINNVNGMVYRCRNDRNWTMEFVSDQCEKLTGYRPEQLLHNKVVAFADLIHQDDRELVWATVQQAVRMRRPFELQYRICTANGRIKQVWEQGIAIYNRGGEVAALEGFIQDRTLLHQLSRKLVRQDTYDSITGLLNARTFADHLAEAIRSIDSRRTGHALMVVDLDRFTVVNEISGLVAGDELLRLVAGILRGTVRGEDLLARIGGDKFAVLLQHCPLDRALEIAGTISGEIEKLEYDRDDRKFRITASTGLVMVDDISMNREELLQQVNHYCKAAKALGRNRICHPGQEEVQNMISRYRDEIIGVSLINEAFESNRFYLCYQPIIPIAAAGGDLSFEVLIRMEGEDGEVIPPSFFISVAETYGLTDKMDKWVIDTTLTWLEDNPELLASMRYCSINLSGQSLDKPSVMDFIIGRLENSIVLPEKICFEITETAAIADFNAASRFIRALRAIGCSFALDDFGSGLSSFAYLKSLDVDYIKIDGQFVRDMARDRVDYESVLAIVRVAKTTGKKTIAEFVEDASILEKLREIGVDYGQGYHFARPRRLENLLKN